MCVASIGILNIHLSDPIREAGKDCHQGKSIFSSKFYLNSNLSLYDEILISMLDRSFGLFFS